MASDVRRAVTAAGAKMVAVSGPPRRRDLRGRGPGRRRGASRRHCRRAPGARVVLPDEVVRAGVEARLAGGGAAHRAPLARARAGLDAALRRFEATFERTFGRRPGPYAALGHAAMETVLAALGQAADGTAPASGGGSAAFLRRAPARPSSGR